MLMSSVSPEVNSCRSWLSLRSSARLNKAKDRLW
uniref:Uncharacterized protein n=1 Tax=Arundo donax TaxID=35708 RepID=A0A0A9ER13_ARUDO